MMGVAAWLAKNSGVPGVRLGLFHYVLNLTWAPRTYSLWLGFVQPPCDNVFNDHKTK